MSAEEVSYISEAESGNASLPHDPVVGDLAMPDFAYGDLPALLQDEVPPRTKAEQSVENVADVSEEWLTLRGLAEALQVSGHIAKKLIVSKLEEHPEWQKIPNTGKANPRPLYHASLLTEVREKAEIRVPRAPEGWATTNNLKDELGVDFRTVQRLTAEITQEIQDGSRVYANKSNQPKTYFSPQVIEAVKQKLGESYEMAPQGWATKKDIERQYNVSYDFLKKVLEPYKEECPEAFKEYRHSQKRSVVEHISPAILEQVHEELSGSERAPEGWQPLNSMAKSLDISLGSVNNLASSIREDYPELFKHYRASGGSSVEHISPELTPLLRQKASADFAPRPEKWMSISDLAAASGRSDSYIRKQMETLCEEHPEWTRIHQVGRRSTSLYSNEAAELFLGTAERRPEAPEGWLNRGSLCELLTATHRTVNKIIEPLREEHPEWFSNHSDRLGRSVEFFSPEVAQHVEQTLKSRQPAPEGWATGFQLSKLLGCGQSTIQNIAAKFNEEHPEWTKPYSVSKGQIREHYHPDLVKKVQDELNSRETATPEWHPARQLAATIGISPATLKKLADTYRDTNPEWFGLRKIAGEGKGKGAVIEHYHTELGLMIRDQVAPRLEVRKHKQEHQDLNRALTETLADVERGESIQSQEFQALVGLFGAERAVDILYQQHPEYKKLPVPYVKSTLAEYLGGFLTIKGDFSLDGLEKGALFLAHGVFSEGLTEVIKNDCLRLLNSLSKIDPDQVTVNSVIEYINHIRQETGGFTNDHLKKVLDEVEAYYELLFENIHKPDRFVDGLDESRLFPDINQRINVQEIAFKKKMLIGDDMGMGKSASAIMAKEIIGARQALVIVPSNVLPVWQTYLSDQVGNDGEQLGYFKPGQAPNVLVVDSVEALQAASAEDYDYILISQERLNEKHVGKLEEFDYDMLIVDEMHKLKNITSGQRAENLVRLAERIDGEDRYLALLSGTPVPNKISDVAITLKLLYPEKFGEVDNKKLVSQILDGDMLDLRSLLVPRMQMKSLAESVDMPDLEEKVRTVELSDQEKDIYEVLIEEDELTATEKLATLRQFLLNPRLLDATPNLTGTKALEVGAALRKTFSEKDKVVMFVNGYIEGVIRGDGTIVDDLDVPSDVDVYTIDGSVSKQHRLEIDQELQQPGRRILLLVSGQTADVGVDFSAAQEVIHYNEPWSLYEKGQQRGRVFRPGLQDKLIAQTFIAENTIEQGIHTYIKAKHQAVEKLLKGIPVAEIEKAMLRQAEKQAVPNIEANQELAKYYFSSRDKMTKIYGHVKELGEKDFRKFLARYDRDYADSYADLVGSRSYQANVARLSSSLISAMTREKGQQRDRLKVLDLASGPEMLRRHMPEDIADRVVSLDINKQHFTEPGKKAVGSFVNLPIADNSVDYVNLSLALHYTKLITSKHDYERLQVLQEVNRVLVTGGRATVSMIYSLGLDDTQTFQDAIGKLGLKVVQAYSGEASAGKNFQTQVITLEKVANCPRDMNELARTIGPQGLRAFKFKPTNRSLRDSRRMVRAFSLNGKTLATEFNKHDQAVLNEEEKVTTEMESLRHHYGAIENIPKADIYQNNFARIFNGKRYVLFKRLLTDAGAVVIH